MRSLQTDAPRRALWALAAGALLLGGWSAWFVLARVPVHVGGTSARLEVDRAAHAVDSPVGGRIVESALSLGAEVTAGDVLVRLADAEQQLRLEEERRRLTALAPELAALAQQVEAEERALQSSRATGEVAIEEARARQREAESAARFAAQQFERAEALHQQGQLSAAELQRAQAAAATKKEAATSARLGGDRSSLQRRTDESDRRARIEALRANLEVRRGEQAAVEAAVQRREDAMRGRLVRAPITGRVASVGELRVGTVVEPGHRLATVLPDGDLRVVARFDPAVAVGRIRPGQPARLRLDGFPWTQYGSVPAVVTDVAAEPRDGRVRVVLSIGENANPRVPLQHGLTGGVEVEVERAAPAALVLRAAGRLGAGAPARVGEQAGGA